MNSNEVLDASLLKAEEDLPADWDEKVHPSQVSVCTSALGFLVRAKVL
jgi:ABC-type sulfate transport system substrate-binding protein